MSAAVPNHLHYDLPKLDFEPIPELVEELGEDYLILDSQELGDLLDDLDEAYEEIDELNKVADNNEDAAHLFAAALEYISAIPPEDASAAPYVAEFARSLAVYKAPEEL